MGTTALAAAFPVVMKALIVDPGLHSRGGHHFNAVKRLQDELSALRVDSSCLASAYADRDVMDALGCTATFTRSVYGRTYAASGEFAQGVEETSRQLTLALKRQAVAASLLLLPCCDQVLAAAVARHLRRRWLPARPHILLWLLYGPHYKRATDDPLAIGSYGECRDAFADLRASVDGDRRLKAYCETPAMADFYRGLLGVEIEVMPGPGLAIAGRAPRPSMPGHPPTVVCIGFANRPKGYRLLPEAVEEVLRSHRKARFLIHGIVRGLGCRG